MRKCCYIHVHVDTKKTVTRGEFWVLNYSGNKILKIHVKFQFSGFDHVDTGRHLEPKETLLGLWVHQKCVCRRGEGSSQYYSAPVLARFEKEKGREKGKEEREVVETSSRRCVRWSNTNMRWLHVRWGGPTLSGVSAKRSHASKALCSSDQGRRSVAKTEGVQMRTPARYA